MSFRPGKAPDDPASGRRFRRHVRYRADFPVEITIFAANEYRHLSGHCKDLSEAGIGILIAAEIAPGEVCSLQFTLPGEKAAWNVRGVLRYRRGYHYGLEFLSLSPDYHAALLKFLDGQEDADT